MRRLTMALLVCAISACGKPAPSSAPAAGSVIESQTDFLARCSREMIASNPQAKTWADSACQQTWETAVAAGPMAEAILAAQVERAPPTLNFYWQKTGELIPYDVVGALRGRGVEVVLVGCQMIGAGEVQKTYLVTVPGHAPFGLTIYARDAPTADADSIYNVGADLSGQAPTLALLQRDGGGWTPTCPA